jgi:hypothetical protein
MRRAVQKQPGAAASKVADDVESGAGGGRAPSKQSFCSCELVESVWGALH